MEKWGGEASVALTRNRAVSGMHGHPFFFLKLVWFQISTRWCTNVHHCSLSVVFVYVWSPSLLPWLSSSVPALLCSVCTAPGACLVVGTRVWPAVGLCAWRQADGNVHRRPCLSLLLWGCRRVCSQQLGPWLFLHLCLVKHFQKYDGPLWYVIVTLINALLPSNSPPPQCLNFLDCLS